MNDVIEKYKKKQIGWLAAIYEVMYWKGCSRVEAERILNNA